jgi:hypothetical protein
MFSRDFSGISWACAGFRERVCHIRLAEDEGGLNLSVNEEAVKGLMMRGAYAGESFGAFSFATHRFDALPDPDSPRPALRIVPPV